MSEMRQQLLMLKGALTETGPEFQAQVQECYDKLKATVTASELKQEGAGFLAFTLLGMEHALENGA